MTEYPHDFQIKEAGLYPNMPAEIYRADPCPTPSLSNSNIRDLLDKSPFHVAWSHPRLFNKRHTDPKLSDPNPSMTKGTLLHKLLLGAGAEITVIDADDYKGKTARIQKEEALAEHRIPVLAKQYDLICKCAETTKVNIRNHPACHGFFDAGVSEAVIAWQEKDIWCRGMLDRLPDDPAFPIFDLKGTDLSAAPISWERRLRDTYRTQGIFYNRGLEKIGRPRSQPMRYIVVEMYEPFEMAVFTASEELTELATAEIERAIRIWGHCIKNKEWKGYPDALIEVSPTPWMLDQISTQEACEAARGFQS